ncbi:hypothetical protein [Streptomyces sp. Ac-502]|uniref:hypothetical protein n=1 Tax=Streptomyces sp. Ac-502 TaxID=3342801 RepID=UPI003862D28D
MTSIERTAYPRFKRLIRTDCDEHQSAKARRGRTSRAQVEHLGWADGLGGTGAWLSGVA